MKLSGQQSRAAKQTGHAAPSFDFTRSLMEKPRPCQQLQSDAGAFARNISVLWWRDATASRDRGIIVLQGRRYAGMQR
jgi:hypothetical protein